MNRRIIILQNAKVNWQQMRKKRLIKIIFFVLNFNNNIIATRPANPMPVYTNDPRIPY